MSVEENTNNSLAPREETNTGGRPTAYRKAFDEQVYKLCLLGATDAEIAVFLAFARNN